MFPISFHKFILHGIPWESLFSFFLRSAFWETCENYIWALFGMGKSQLLILAEIFTVIKLGEHRAKFYLGLPCHEYLWNKINLCCLAFSLFDGRRKTKIPFLFKNNRAGGAAQTLPKIKGSRRLQNANN